MPVYLNNSTDTTPSDPFRAVPGQSLILSGDVAGASPKLQTKCAGTWYDTGETFSEPGAKTIQTSSPLRVVPTANSAGVTVCLAD